MATIEIDPGLSTEQIRAELAAMADPHLLAQDLVQQGAINAVSWLLANGCHAQLAT